MSVAFSFPFTAPTFEPMVGRRVRIDSADLDPTLNDGAVHLVEAIALHAQDAAAGLGANNQTVRPLVVGSPSGGGWSLAFGGPAVQHSALHAWADLDPIVRLESVEIDGDGRFLVASRVEEIAAGQWQHESAVMNVNSDRALGSFTVAGSPKATVSEIAFDGIAHHSGEPYSSDPWNASVTDGTTLTVRMVPDPDISKLVMEYDLLILPMYFEHDRHARMEMPLDNVDRDAVAAWLDDRIISCVRSYLSIQDNEFYLRRAFVEDPVSKTRFLRDDAVAVIEHNGRKLFFKSNETLEQFRRRQEEGGNLRWTLDGTASACASEAAFSE